MNIEHDYIAIGSKMAQALQDIIDETCQAENCQTQAERCPAHAPDIAALVDEWEQLYSQSGLAWKNQIQETDGDEISLIASL